MIWYYFYLKHILLFLPPSGIWQQKSSATLDFRNYSIKFYFCEVLNTIFT